MNETELQTVGVVAKKIGVSVRTLHHWDEIGLVNPDVRTATGYRRYSDAAIERLHQVLLYRELGFSLEKIAALLDDPSTDKAEQLAHQKSLLLARIDRLHHMVAGVEKLMDSHKTGIQLTLDEQRQLFGDDWVDGQYVQEAEKLWGDTPQWRQSQEWAGQQTKEDWSSFKTKFDRLTADFADALRAGVVPGSEQANVLARRHRDAMTFDCSSDMHRNIASLYVGDPRYTRYYDAHLAGLAQYVHDVIVAAY